MIVSLHSDECAKSLWWLGRDIAMIWKNHCNDFRKERLWREENRVIRRAFLPEQLFEWKRLLAWSVKIEHSESNECLSLSFWLIRIKWRKSMKKRDFYGQMLLQEEDKRSCGDESTADLYRVVRNHFWSVFRFAARSVRLAGILAKMRLPMKGYLDNSSINLFIWIGLVLYENVCWRTCWRHFGSRILTKKLFQLMVFFPEGISELILYANYQEFVGTKFPLISVFAGNFVHSYWIFLRLV